MAKLIKIDKNLSNKIYRFILQNTFLASLNCLTIKTLMLMYFKFSKQNMIIKIIIFTKTCKIINNITHIRLIQEHLSKAYFSHKLIEKEIERKS